MAIFSKFFDDLISHIKREYAGEKMKQFLNVSPLAIMDFLLYLFQPIRLYFRLTFRHCHFCKKTKLYASVSKFLLATGFLREVKNLVESMKVNHANKNIEYFADKE